MKVIFIGVKSPKGALSPTGSTTFAPGEEWGEFLHQSGQKYYNFADIRQEIVKDTEKVTGKNAGNEIFLDSIVNGFKDTSNQAFPIYQLV